MASPTLYARFEPKLYERVVAAAEADGLTVSGWLRRAALDRLGDTSREAAERAALLAEARRFLSVDPNGSQADRAPGITSCCPPGAGVSELPGRREPRADV